MFGFNIPGYWPPAPTVWDDPLLLGLVVLVAAGIFSAAFLLALLIRRRVNESLEAQTAVAAACPADAWNGEIHLVTPPTRAQARAAERATA